MENSTAQKILDVAQEMVRNRGYNAFSYADISDRVGIRKASIHYHFASKGELVTALVRRYRQDMGRACARIAQSGKAPYERLLLFANLYRDSLGEHQICLCAMLAADFEVLPEAIQQEIQGFFADTEGWLSQLLQQGCDANLWDCQPSIQQAAKGLIAMLQGAQLLARSSANGTATFEQVVHPLLASQFLRN